MLSKKEALHLDKLTISSRLLSETELMDNAGRSIAQFIVENVDKELITKLKELSKKYNFLIFEDRKFCDIGNTFLKQYDFMSFMDFIQQPQKPQNDKIIIRFYAFCDDKMTKYGTPTLYENPLITTKTLNYVVL